METIVDKLKGGCLKRIPDNLKVADQNDQKDTDNEIIQKKAEEQKEEEDRRIQNQKDKIEIYEIYGRNI